MDTETMREWDHADGPEAHPLWAEQVEMERRMLASGAERVADRVVTAQANEKMTDLRQVRNLVDEWLPEITEALKDWIRQAERTSKRGPRPVALSLLKPCDPYVASLVAIRALLDGLANKRQTLTSLAMRIGKTLEHEQKVRLWEGGAGKEAREDFWNVQERLRRQKSTAPHKRRVNILMFNRHRAENKFGLDWVDWREDETFRVGWALLDIIIRRTGRFELLADPFHHQKGKADRAKLIIAPTPAMVEWLGRALEFAELNSPEYKPTIMPPKRWTSSRDGGYWTPYVKTPRLVRFKASMESQKDRAADEYDAIDMPKVYDALHVLQETAWQINRPVFEIMHEAWTRDLAIAGLPELTDRPLPNRTARMEAHGADLLAWKLGGKVGPKPKPDEETEEEVRRWKKRAGPIWKHNATRLAQVRKTDATISIAREYLDQEAIYFPHMLDFRGRFYPIPAYLQPQGDDIARGLLTFAEGAPVSSQDASAAWLAIQLATMMGEDKVSFDQRIKWVEDQEDLWLKVAADPLGEPVWQDKKEAWQALAAILDWVGYLKEGDGYVSNLPVMVDGTCNGIQHLSAIIRDKEAGRHVNLVPGESPQDIYKFVAADLQAILVRIREHGGPEGDKAAYWLALCNDNLPRTLTKRQVMVVPYGGKLDSFFGYTREWLDAADPEESDFASDAEQEAYRDRRNKHVVFMAQHMWTAVHSTVQAGVSVMKWLQDCAKPAATVDQPVYWVTPSGFVVRHFYGMTKAVQVNLMLDGEKHNVTRHERTAQMSTREQLQGISPNFIHSLDASALVECLSLCHAAGLRSFAAIHDAYGTHAANMPLLFRLLREGFVATHRVEVLDEFRKGCIRVIVADLVGNKGLDPLEAYEKAEDMLPKTPARGDLRLEDVLESDYFFA